jgi:hypothetical protein
LAIDAPAGRTAILYVVALLAVLHIVMVEQTVCVDAGTVQRVVSVAAAGLDCPRTL